MLPTARSVRSEPSHQERPDHILEIVHGAVQNAPASALQTPDPGARDGRRIGPRQAEALRYVPHHPARSAVEAKGRHRNNYPAAEPEGGAAADARPSRPSFASLSRSSGQAKLGRF
jgi:hypothetical protein